MDKQGEDIYSKNLKKYCEDLRSGKIKMPKIYTEFDDVCQDCDVKENWQESEQQRRVAEDKLEILQDKLNKVLKRAIAERDHAIDIEDNIPTSIWHGVVMMLKDE